MEEQQKKEKFLVVLEAHKGLIYKVTNAYCNNEEDRKDLVQEIVFQLWKSFERYQAQFQYSTWIYRIALNVAISFYRKEKSRKIIANPLTESVLAFVETSIFSEEKEQHLKQLEQFIASLKELDKALMLLYLEGKSHKEMAEIMGISESNVATKISRIKIGLKEKFSQI